MPKPKRTGPNDPPPPSDAQRLLELAALALLEQGPNHGYALHKQLDQRNPGLTTRSPLYGLLHRLSAEGLLEREEVPFGKDTRARYTITDSGLKQLNTLREEREAALSKKSWMLRPHGTSGALT